MKCDVGCNLSMNNDLNEVLVNCVTRDIMTSSVEQTPLSIIPSSGGVIDLTNRRGRLAGAGSFMYVVITFPRRNAF